jgi:hypothetical protein
MDFSVSSKIRPLHLAFANRGAKCSATEFMQ